MGSVSQHMETREDGDSALAAGATTTNALIKKKKKKSVSKDDSSNTNPAKCYKALKTILPAKRVDGVLRSNLKSKRVSSGSSIFTTAAVEELTKVIFQSMSENAATKKDGTFKRQTRVDLIKAIRGHPDLAKFFRRYTFAAKGNAIRYDRMRLLRKADRETLMQKRQDDKSKREAAAKAKAGEAINSRSGGLPGIEED